MNDQDTLFDKVLRGVSTHNNYETDCSYCPYECRGSECFSAMLLDIETALKDISDRKDYMDSH